MLNCRNSHYMPWNRGLCTFWATGPEIVQKDYSSYKFPFLTGYPAVQLSTAVHISFFYDENFVKTRP